VLACARTVNNPLSGAPTFATPSSRGFEPSQGSLANEIAFKLGKGTENMKYKLSCGRTGLASRWCFVAIDDGFLVANLSMIAIWLGSRQARLGFTIDRGTAMLSDADRPGCNRPRHAARLFRAILE
jgi:hypothetical protein